MCVEDKIHHCRAEFNFFLKYSSLLFRCIFSFVILILAESAKYQVKRLFTTKKEVRILFYKSDYHISSSSLLSLASSN